ncbi:MAG: hypothetical protein EBR82_69160 [Caulobacteraceae bacterium]|nr:hypothetical protein [Caulobacteraceae bacterium]
MTDKEARSFFLDEVFVAFPAVQLWIKETSPQPDKTLGYWCKALDSVSVDEAREVLEIWVAGKDQNNKPPEAYQRDVFALHLKSCVYGLRDRRATKARFDEPTAAVDEPEGERYRPTEDPLYLKYWVPLRAAVATGEITEESALAQWKAILDEQFSKAGGTTWIG